MSPGSSFISLLLSAPSLGLGPCVDPSPKMGLVALHFIFHPSKGIRKEAPGSSRDLKPCNKFWLGSYLDLSVAIKTRCANWLSLGRRFHLSIQGVESDSLRAQRMRLGGGGGTHPRKTGACVVNGMRTTTSTQGEIFLGSSWGVGKRLLRFEIRGDIIAKSQG